MPSQTVLLAGATGMLGGRIAHHLLEMDEATVRLLVRPETLADADKRAALDPLTDRGALLVEGDVADRDSLDSATRGVDIVVSALQGGRQIVVDGQIALARAAAANDVRRFLPSDFALDLFKATPGEHAAFDLRREAGEAIDQLDIEVVHVLNGGFLDGVASPGALVDFDDQAGVVTFWGRGDERFEVTTVDDTARYAARAALDLSPPSGKFAVAGQLISFEDIISHVERQQGRTYERRSLGTAEDLRAWVDRQRADGDATAALYGTYKLYMVTGQTSLDDLQNDRYPDIDPATLEALS